MPNLKDIDAYEVVVLGAGYAGLMAAFGLTGRNRLARVALINERDEFVERIRLQENLSGPVAARLPPLAQLLRGTRVSFIRGRVESLDAVRHRVRVSVDGECRELSFKRCIYALGSNTDQSMAVGINEYAYRLDPGNDVRSANALRARLELGAGRPLRVVVVGGGNTATEAAGEIKSTWPKAEVTMVSRSRAGDFGKGNRLERLVRGELQSLEVRLVDGQTVTTVRADAVDTACGKTYTADICVWAAGVRAPSIARQAGLAVDAQDRICADPKLSSTSHHDILAVGDALRPLAPTGARYRLSAFVAIISGAYAARRIVHEAKGGSARPFSFSAYGQGVAIGHRGIGFFTFPNDIDAYAVVGGPLALRIRNLFVWALVFFLKLERLFPGSSLFWIGRRRVSWQLAVEALRNSPHQKPVLPAATNTE
jgi:NADH dehydrogenase